MTENKFSKYLGYTIGEIIHVGIGILIVLNGSNSDVQNKLDLKEQGILKELNLNSKHNQAQLSSVIKDSQRAEHVNIPFFEKTQLLNSSNLEFNDSP
ncbi:MAG: hypothetical protein ACI9DK_000259 [Vicingaceae bacterium]